MTAMLVAMIDFCGGGRATPSYRWRFPGFVGGCGSPAASIVSGEDWFQALASPGECRRSHSRAAGLPRSTRDKIMYGAAKKTWELPPTTPGNTAGAAACPSFSRHL